MVMVLVLSCYVHSVEALLDVLEVLYPGKANILTPRYTKGRFKDMQKLGRRLLPPPP